MIWAWLTKRALFGLTKGMWVGVGLAALAALYAWLSMREAADDRHNQEIGAQGAIIVGQKQTLDQLKDAKDAESNLGGERSGARYSDCLLDSRNKAACERYNPYPGQ